MGRRRTSVVSALALIGSAGISVVMAPSEALAYIQTVTPTGSPVQWPSGFTFNLAGNPANRSGLGAGDFFSAVSRSLQRWQTASGGSVNFGYWQGTDASIYVPNSDYNGVSSVYFASNASGATGLSPNILGLTQVWYNSDNGQILEADTVLNDLDFTFTTNPSDTSGYGSGQASYGSSQAKVFVENVLTHEFGHSLGLAHSAGLQATMLFMESPEQAHLGCDEQVAIHDVYPSGDAGSRGAITGTVVAASGGGGIFGAHVEAISRRRGTVLGAGITDRSGRFTIGALEPGTYFLMVEPYLAGAGALPSFYSTINLSSCGSQAFRRTFLTDASGRVPQAVEVVAGGSTSAPVISAECGQIGAFAADSEASAPVITGADPTGFGAIDSLSASGGTRYYQIQSVSGHIEIHAIGFSLFSPIHVTLGLVTASGAAVPQAQASQEVYYGDSGYVNYDSEVVADGLPDGDYLISASSDVLSSTLYPTGTLMLDTDPFVLITGSMNEGAPALASSLSVNARCRQAENFAAYQSPPGNPPVASTQSGGGGGGFCGTIDPSNRGNRGNRGDGGDGGTGAGAIAGWLLPWLLMGAMARLGARLSRRLLAGSASAG